MSTNTHPVKNFLAGGFGGVCLVLVGHPPDTLKVRLQTQPVPPIYKGTFDCARKVIVHEGALGLYKGMFTPLIGITPLNAIYFLGYSTGRRIQTPDQHGNYSACQIFTSGMMAPLFAAPITIPVERIKCILQVQQASKAEAKFSGPWDCAKKLAKQSGVIRGLYRGSLATFIRDIPFGGLYFLTYESAKKYLTPLGKEMTGAVLKSNMEGWHSHPHILNNCTSDLSLMRISLAGALAGVLPLIFAVPADVIKSRIQTATEGENIRFIHTVRTLLKKEGPRAFYKGTVPLLIRSSTANAACFAGYELAMKLADWIAPNI